jgi:septal ring factor EnvC (AmiA/AmiB activator)
MKTAFAIFFILALFHHPLLSSASERERVKQGKKLEDVEKRLRQTEKDISRISKKETDILGELERINKLLKKTRGELAVKNDSIKKTSSRIEDGRERIRNLSAEKSLLHKRLEKRLRAIHEMRNRAMLRMVFSIDNPLDLSRKYRYMALLMDYDRRLVESTERNIEEIKREKAALETLLARYNSEKKSAEAKRWEAEGLRRDRKVLLSSVRREKEKNLKLESELREARKELQGLMKRLVEEAEESPGGFAALRGKLRAPVEGKVVAFYGKVEHPKFKTVTFNNGIVIEAGYGAVVKNVADGRVLHAGWLKGYGEVVVIDHGGGFYTLYANLSEVFKNKGDTVEEREPVGKVGDYGTSDSAGLYFEIRQKGVPKDPLLWISHGTRVIR